MVQRWDKLRPVLRQNSTVQNAMQRFQMTRPAVELTDHSHSPERDIPSETDKVVPDSFAEWLAQPSATITGGPEPEQGIFVGLMRECQIQTTEDHRPTQLRRP
jgi:hypothetical protein